MAKMIRYKTVITVNHGTESEPNMEQIILDKTIACADRIAYDANYPIAEKEAVLGTIEVSGEFDYPIAPCNITEGEYVTIGSVLYKASMNIPSGERVIVGQNAIETTVEAQLYELKGE